jgi:tetratricopeptide (TPR) repeat protein
VLVSAPQLGKFKRLDEALYFYAFELGQLKREAEMKEAYIRLIQDYPNSQYIPNAYLSFADYYFGQSKIGDALQLYEKVITFKDSPVYAYALYKMAWCHLNPVGTADPRYDLSLDFFVKTIRRPSRAAPAPRPTPSSCAATPAATSSRPSRRPASRPRRGSSSRRSATVPRKTRTCRAR